MDGKEVVGWSDAIRRPAEARKEGRVIHPTQTNIQLLHPSKDHKTTRLKSMVMTTK